MKHTAFPLPPDKFHRTLLQPRETQFTIIWWGCSGTWKPSKYTNEKKFLSVGIIKTIRGIASTYWWEKFPTLSTMIKTRVSIVKTQINQDILRLSFTIFSHHAGEHGYDNNAPQMHAFFAARGPRFRRRYHRTSLQNLDIYPLVSYMLSLDPSHITVKPNGTLSDIVTILDTRVAFDFANPEKRHVLNYFIPKTPMPPLRQISWPALKILIALSETLG